MSDHVHWLVEFEIKDGQREAFKALMEEMVAATWANEPATMNYEWFLGEDQRTCHIYERYVDSAATMVHLKTFGQTYAERFLKLAEPAGFTLYGNPDAQVLEALAAVGPTRMIEFGGFAR